MALRYPQPIFSATSTPWSPLSLPGLAVWYDGASAKYNSVSPDVLATGSQTVREWRPGNAGGPVLAQTTGSQQPLNAADGLTFDGANDLMLATLAAGTTDFTFGAVFSRQAGSDGKIMEFGDLAGFDESGSLYSNPTHTTFRRTDGAGFAAVATPAESGLNAVIATYGSAGLKLRSHLSATVAVNATVSTVATTHLRIGQGSSGLSPYAGEIRQIVVCTGVLSAANQALLGHFLAARAGRVWRP